MHLPRRYVEFTQNFNLSQVNAKEPHKTKMTYDIEKNPMWLSSADFLDFENIFLKNCSKRWDIRGKIGSD